METVINVASEGERTAKTATKVVVGGCWWPVTDSRARSVRARARTEQEEEEEEKRNRGAANSREPRRPPNEL